jgi:hypothetical protein
MKLRFGLMTGLITALLAAAVPLLPRSAVRAEAGTGQEAEETLKIPEKLPELWNLVHDKQAALGEIINAKALDKVHVTAFQIRDLILAMPDKSHSLSADNQNKLNESAARVGDVAKLLDEYGDGGDQAKVQEQAARLGKLLTYVESLYPAGTLGSRRAVAGPHGGAVVTSGAYRLELVSAQGELSLFVLNPANQAAPIEKMTAMAMAGAKAETHVALQAAGDHFTGKFTVPKTGSILVNVTVSSADQNLEGHFVVSEKGVMAQASAGEGHKAGFGGQPGQRK